MSEEFEKATPQGVRDLVRIWRNEWQRRTWYGKLRYPFWLAMELLTFGLLFLIFTFLAPGEMTKPIRERTTEPIFRTIAEFIAKLNEPLPDVYHDE